jgi:hypothetical protein
MIENQLTLADVALKELQKGLEAVKQALEELSERTTKTEVEIGVLRAGCEVMFHTLELNGLLVGGEAAKVQGSNPRSEPKGEAWDPAKIVWELREGSKGQYERSEDPSNVEFKKMLKDLGAHKGKLFRNGWFYWVFIDGSVVGRKQKLKAKP